MEFILSASKVRHFLSGKARISQDDQNVSKNPKILEGFQQWCKNVQSFHEKGDVGMLEELEDNILYHPKC